MILQSKRVWCDEAFCPRQLELADGVIRRVLPYGHTAPDRDYGDARILPGLIEIHAHGYRGHLVTDGDRAWLESWMAYLPSEGVTGILPASSSAPEEHILRGFSLFAEAMEAKPRGARILGLYSEGPFMCEKYRGAQDLRYLTVPDAETYARYQNAARGQLRYCMVAPEMFGGDMSFIRLCAENGVRVACGHTGATFAEIAAARDAGAVSFTHTFNGMRGLHHREPGVVGAAMYFGDMYAELIGDGAHVLPVPAKLLADAKGKDFLITVTDSVAAKGATAAECAAYGVALGADGLCRGADGTICGSARRLCDNLQNEVENMGFDLVTAVNSVTCNPARMLGFANRIGYLREGYDADIAVLDERWQPVETFVSGESVFRS